MSMPDLVSALEAEANAEVAAVLTRARAEADRLRREAQLDRSAAMDGEVARFRAACEADAYREVATATRQLRNQVLHERAALLARVREAIAARLPACLTDDAVVRRLAERGLSVAGERATAIRCSPTIVDRVRTAADGLEIVVDESLGSGLSIALAGGRASVEVTLEGELERHWPELQIETLAALSAEAS